MIHHRFDGFQIIQYPAKLRRFSAELPGFSTLEGGREKEEVDIPLDFGQGSNQNESFSKYVPYGIIK
jgi:hypothetical protein